jgi:uncharacterized protein
MQANIAELWIYPIKGCAGTRLSAVPALSTGLQFDRCMMVVDAQSGRFITQRSHPAMALIKPSIVGHSVHLEGLNQPPVSIPLNPPLDIDTAFKSVTVWNDTLPAQDMGKAAANWFSQALNNDVRLVRFDTSQQRKVKGSDHITHQFADGYPYLMLSKASLRALNERLMKNSGQSVRADRFRANIILDDVDAHTEDFSESMEHPSGGRFIMQSPCTRCEVPNIDQTTGVRNALHEPSLTLSQYRYDKALGGVTFGMNAALERRTECLLREGDVLALALAF